MDAPWAVVLGAPWAVMLDASRAVVLDAPWADPKGRLKVAWMAVLTAEW